MRHQRAAGTRRLWPCCLIVFCLLNLRVVAQSTSGEIAGIVRDSTGAVLVGARVELRDTERHTRTGADGSFQFTNLPPGDYAVVVALDGFASDTLAVRLQPGDRQSLAITLMVRLLADAVVTADKTGERDLQSTPIAVSVLPEAELRRSESHTLEDLAGWAPSLTFSQNTGFAQLTIRGIGTNAVFAGSDPSSTVYQDGVYLARPAMVLSDLLDLERVEVLRGPQGTLYGRNAVGGAINVVTQPPADVLDASARFVAGNLGTLRAEARVSGPIVRNRMMGSISLLRGVQDGFVTDVNHIDHPLGGEDVTASRGKLLFAFNPKFELQVSADVTQQTPTPLTYSKVLAVKPGFVVDNPADPREVRTSVLADSRNLQYGGSARLAVRLAPEMTLTSLSAFRRLEYDVLTDADITELDLTTTHVREIHRQFSEELTLAREGSRLTWIAGLFTFDDRDRQPTTVRLGGPRLENRLNPDVDTSSRAVFGQATFRIAPQVSVTAGLRYTREAKAIVNSGALYPFDTPDVATPGSLYTYTDRIEHAAWTPKAGIEVRVRDGMMAYASSTRGFKSGGFNPTSQSAGLGYAPEWAWSHEGGLKVTLAQGRARANVAAYHTSYTDLQVQTTIRPGVIDISNAAAATITGVEIEGAGSIGRTVQMGGHFAWIDATYDQYLAVGVGGVTSDAAGHRLSNAPEWSGRAWVEWRPPIGAGRALSLRGESRWQSVVFFTPVNDTIQRQRSYAVVDAGLEFQPNGWWCALGGFARNVLDEDYITGTFGSPPPAIGGRPGKPREIGIQVTIRNSRAVR